MEAVGILTVNALIDFVILGDQKRSKNRKENAKHKEKEIEKVIEQGQEE